MKLRGIILLTCLLWMSTELTGFDQVFAKSRSKPTQELRLERQLESLLKNYRNGKSSIRVVWAASARLNNDFTRMNTNSKIRLRQLQANLSLKAGYPILASIYASESILLSNEPFSNENAAMWDALAMISRARPIQYIVEELAGKLKDSATPPAFGNDWNYILGNYQLEQGKMHLAKRYFEKLTMQDRYFMPSQYQLALIEFSDGDLKGAEARLASILDPTSRAVNPLTGSDQVEMWNYANIALGRMYYENKQFMQSAQHYRKVTKTSPLYYDSLFEQSWSLFLGGRLKHALGTLYGVHAPYFSERFNPESKVLESLIYFWMCRYDRARNALADFAEEHSETVESLAKFLDRQRLSPETSYRLFENLISGVSSASLGIPRNVLLTAADRDPMLLVRDQYANLITEIDRLQTVGFFGIRRGLKPQEARLEKINQSLRNSIGEKFLVELRSLKEHYESLYSQAQFLYLELLMSEKEQLLGRELHASSKVKKLGAMTSLNNWSQKSQSWEDDKDEYWWDEIGFQIIDIEPMCNQ